MSNRTIVMTNTFGLVRDTTRTAHSSEPADIGVNSLGIAHSGISLLKQNTPFTDKATTGIALVVNAYNFYNNTNLTNALALIETGGQILSLAPHPAVKVGGLAISILAGAANTILMVNDANSSSNTSNPTPSDNKNSNSTPQSPSGSIPNKPTTDIPYNPDPNQPKPNQPKSFEQNFEESNPGSDVTTVGNNKGRPIYRIELADGTVIYTDNPNSSMIDNLDDQP